MKKYLLLAMFVTNLVYGREVKVPMSWISEDSYNEFNQHEKSASIVKQTEDGIEFLLNKQSQLIENTKKEDDSKWYLQSIMTELALEKKGNLGILAGKGEVGVELVWTRRANSKKSIKFEDLGNDEGQDIFISSEMNNEDIKKEIMPIYELALASGKIKNQNALFENLMKKAIDFQSMIRTIENSDVDSNWFPYKYQLELQVSMEGKVSPVFVAGTVLRFRMEWWRLEKKTTKKLVTKRSPSFNEKFISALASDLSVLSEIKLDNGFEFNFFKIGLGVGVEGKFQIAKAKGHAIGSIFFMKKQNSTKSVSKSFSEISTYPMIENNIHQISRDSFREGLVKSGKIATHFASKAKDNGTSKFQLNVIELEFELFLSGKIGLVTIGEKSVLQVFITRNIVI